MKHPELSDLSDEELLARYTKGELTAMEVLLDRYERPLFSFVLRQVRDRAKAEDLVQESFLRMVEHAASFEGTARLRTWLFRIARNQCIDDARRQVHRRHPSLDAPQGGQPDGASLHERLPAGEVAADRKLTSKQMGGAMAKAIEALPDEQREVFVLRQVQHLSFKEIADITDVSENTVKSRMRYALERLQSALAEYRDYAEELT